MGAQLNDMRCVITEEAVDIADKLAKYFDEACVVTTEQLASVRKDVSDIVSEARGSAVAKSVTKVSSSAKKRLEKAKDIAAECVNEAQPKVAHGFSHFKQQVREDFHSTRNDMSCALKGSTNTNAVEEPKEPEEEYLEDCESSPLASKGSSNYGNFSDIAATIVGVLVAGNLAPFRALRFATFATVTAASSTSKVLRADASTKVASAPAPADTDAVLLADASTQVESAPALVDTDAAVA